MEQPAKTLPTIEKKVDHLGSIVTAVAVVFFLPLPLVLMFGAKALIPLGAVICVAAIVRLINSPVRLEKPSVQMTDPISAAARVAQQQRQNETSVSDSAVTTIFR